MSVDRTCRRGHRVTGENKIEHGKYSICRACRKEWESQQQRNKLAERLNVNEDVRFLLDNPDSLPNWDGIRKWIVETFGVR